MPSIKLNDIEYDTDTLTDAARQTLQMLQLTEQEVQRLQVKLAIMQKAKNAYLATLKSQLPSPLDQVMAEGDTLKFSLD